MLEYTPDRRLTGGLRIAAHKGESTERPIKRGLQPARVMLSLHQHRGPAADPVVSVGAHVRKGQIVATAKSLAGANVHASISGTVGAIATQRVPSFTSAAEALCIVIDADGEPSEIEAAGPEWPTDRVSQLMSLRDAGIVGLGGAVFPTAAKLGTVGACKVLIINGAECEPYISCDDMLMREAADQIVAGAMTMCDLLAAGQCIIAVERDKPQAIDAMRKAAGAIGSERLRLAELPSIYPAGGERQLVEVLTGDEVPAGRYPSDIGYICQNVGTAFAVHRLATFGEPLVTRIVTVTGRGVAGPRNVEAPIGTPIADLIAFCGGYTAAVRRLIHGGNMMGYALPSDTMPITKATNCIIAAAAEEVREDYTQWPCIRCGECGNACPARLLPQDLLIAARSTDHDALDGWGLDECIECGCCDIVCPSHIPLTQIFRRAKQEHEAYRRQLAFSAESEERFRDHERRRRAEADAGKRQQEALKAALKSNAAGKAAIQAAVERARRRQDGDGQAD